ncbi:GGDEF/EAL domain-containing response regulator [Acidisoma sp. 7E03]
MAFVVIVDDRATNRSIFSRLAGFLDENVEVEAFADPDPALRVIGAKMPDLVITDYKMPQMTGAAFTQHIRSLPNGADVPIIVITAYDDRAFRLEALEAGATDFVQTPIDHQEFITRARNLLKIGSRQKQIRNRANALARELEGVEQERLELLRNSRDRLAQVIDTVPAMISAHDRRGECIFANAYQAAVLGKGETDAVEGSGPETERSRQLDARIFATGLPLPAYEEEVTDPTGLRRVFLTTKTPLRGADHAVSGVLTTSLDITERKRAEEHLHFVAHHDALTGLPNRHALHLRLEDTIDAAAARSQEFALHFLDLDRFKSISHAFGHHNGDRLLRAVAQRMSGLIGPDDLIGRLGGDEFAIIQTGIGQGAEARASARRLAETIRAAFDVPFAIDGRSIHTSCSLGTALFPHDGTDQDVLQQSADLAMYRAKSLGRNTVCQFEPALQTAVRDSAQIEIDLRAALARDEFVLHYQPQVDLVTGRILGVEALIRWARNGGELVYPDAFLPVAEEADLMTALSLWVLDAACQQAARWEQAGQATRVGVNFSASLFRNHDVASLVLAAIDRTGVSASLIDLELTETILLEDHEAARTQIARLQARGVTFSVDDFGTGYASFTYIDKLPVNRLKIDGGFIRNISTQPEAFAVIRAMIGLGHNLRMRVIAEGVETAEQLATLRREGCDEVQGYFFSKPLPAEELAQFYRDVAVTGLPGYEGGQG